MGVRVNYVCAFGNNMFQYILARLFARCHKLQLTSAFTPQKINANTTEDHAQHVLSMTPPEVGEVVSGPEIVISDIMPRDPFDPGWPKANYVFQGLFQRSRWYLDRMAEIRKFVVTAPVQPEHPEDLVINLRVGPDYRGAGFMLHPKWYLDILKVEQFRKLHIVCDKIDNDYLKNFSKYNPVVIRSGSSGDFNYLRRFKRIVCANSTFSWWAAFFSNAEKIYTHARWLRQSELAKMGIRPGWVSFEPFANGVAVDGPFHDE